MLLNGAEVKSYSHVTETLETLAFTSCSFLSFCSGAASASGSWYITSISPERSDVTAAVGSAALTNLMVLTLAFLPKYFGLATIVKDSFGVNALTI